MITPGEMKLVVEIYMEAEEVMEVDTVMLHMYMEMVIEVHTCVVVVCTSSFVLAY